MQTKLYTSTQESLLTAIKEALRRLEVNLISVDAEKGQLLGEAPMTWKSYGNKIKVSISSTEWHQHRLSVESISTGLQLIDWGVNGGYEKNIILETTKILYRYEALYSE